MEGIKKALTAAWTMALLGFLGTLGFLFVKPSFQNEKPTQRNIEYPTGTLVDPHEDRRFCTPDDTELAEAGPVNLYYDVAAKCFRATP